MKDVNECFKVVFEAFPVAAESTAVRWGSAEFYPYTNALIDRQDFPVEVIDAIMALQVLHEQVFPHK